MNEPHPKIHDAYKKKHVLQKSGNFLNIQKVSKQFNDYVVIIQFLKARMAERLRCLIQG